MRLQFHLIALAIVTVTAVHVRVAKGDDAEVTYYEHVLPIMQENCQTCHRPSGYNISGLIAPMSFMDYLETRPWARAIARKVEAREMPPWFASAPRGVFENERGLTDEEIDIILKWAEAGAPAGDRADAPPARQWAEDANDGWSLGTPDLVVKLPEPYLVEDDVYDLNITFYAELTEDIMPEDTWVKGWEFRVGDNQITHHMCSSVIPPSGDEHLLGCVAGGGEPDMLPDGFGVLLKTGSSVSFELHFHKEAADGSAVWSDPTVAFFVADGVQHEVVTDQIGNYGFAIPALHPTYRVRSSRVLKTDTVVLSYWPHAHLRATAARYTAVYPDGTEELLLDVPHYDQGWQVTYKYEEPKLLPKGTRIDVAFWYDNSPIRAARHNFNPHRFVGHGTRTVDEMSLGFISYAEIAEDEARGWPRRRSSTIEGVVPSRRSAHHIAPHSTAPPTPKLAPSPRLRTSLTLDGRGIEIRFLPLPTIPTTTETPFTRVPVGNVRAHRSLQLGAPPSHGTAERSYEPRPLWLVRGPAGWLLEVGAPTAAANRQTHTIPLAHRLLPVSSPIFTVSLSATGRDTGQLALRWNEHAWTASLRFAAPRPSPRQLVSGRGDLRTADDSNEHVARVNLLAERNESALTLQSGATVAVVFGKGLGINDPFYGALRHARHGQVVETPAVPVLRLTSEYPLRIGTTELCTGNLAPGSPAIYAVWLRRTRSGWSFLFSDDADSWGVRHDPAFDVADTPADHSFHGDHADRPYSATIVPVDLDRAALTVHWGQHSWTAVMTVDAGSCSAGE